MQLERRKLVKRFAPPEPRPLFYNSNKDVSKEKIPDLDELLETNLESRSPSLMMDPDVGPKKPLH